MNQVKTGAQGAVGLPHDEIAPDTCFVHAGRGLLVGQSVRAVGRRREAEVAHAAEKADGDMGVDERRAQLPQRLPVRQDGEVGVVVAPEHVVADHREVRVGPAAVEAV